MTAWRTISARYLQTALASALLLLSFYGQARAGAAYQALLAEFSGPARQLPIPPPPSRVPVRTDYSYVDPGGIVPARPLAAALNYYRANLGVIDNQRYLSIIDYTRHANEKRFFIVDMRTGRVETFLVAHGKGSDPDHTGFAGLFSNQEGSLATSLGFFLTGKTYTGENGYSLVLHGLSAANSNAFSRYIVIHGASYVDPANFPLGRSWGCPAVELGVRTRLIDMLKGGSVIYAWHDRFAAD
jgi:hypothetical protein